jgi:ABC-2 type transport system ATP-binding protein
MIEIRHLTKRYGPTVALDDLSFSVRPGFVTGFLGPNGAGKSTTMRIVLGLTAPSAGEALVGGRTYRSLARPLDQVGALLDATAVETGRSAVDHLRWLARTHRIGDERVRTLLERVGLAGVARRPISTFSLGMKQRLGIASALLGDPAVLLFDEPVNGLDPDGVRWIRQLLRTLAGEGRTVFLSSHLMSEMALTAERLVIIGRGQLLADTTVSELAEGTSAGVTVRSPRAPELAAAIERAGGRATLSSGAGLLITGSDAATVGRIAAERGIPLIELTPRRASLEEAYMALTDRAVTYRSGATGTGGKRSDG